MFMSQKMANEADILSGKTEGAPDVVRPDRGAAPIPKRRRDTTEL